MCQGSDSGIVGTLAAYRFQVWNANGMGKDVTNNAKENCCHEIIYYDVGLFSWSIHFEQYGPVGCAEEIPCGCIQMYEDLDSRQTVIVQ